MENTMSFEDAYNAKKRIWYTIVTILIAILIAGFWNRGIADGFGRDIIAGGTIGSTGDLADQYDTRGGGFGIIFAAIAGLAATFTACNCVIFAMMPGMACSTGSGPTSIWKTLGAFTAPVVLITGIYGLYIGFLGPVGIEHVNAVEVRYAQSFAVFTALGFAMLFWGILEMGFLDRIKNGVSQTTRDFFNMINVKAVLLGAMVGMFTVGRPYPLFRDFLVYAASAKNPLYGSGVMMIQGLGQIAIMVLLLLMVVWLAGHRISALAASKPYKFQMISGLALIAGGTYFLFYWGLGRQFGWGRWGYKLGWYTG
jgi:hypothetical protein